MISKLTRADGKYFDLIPSFYKTIMTLVEQKRNFKIVFRTFGEDLEYVTKEFNDFCEGKHPSYPGVKFDGSDGSTDFRFTNL